MTFPNPLNVSLQLVDSTTTGSWANNDICYYQANGTTTVTRIGPCIALAGTTVTCDIDVTTPLPSIGDFVFFAISVPDYENLSLNMSELKRYIDQQKTIIVYYEKSINNEYKAQIGIEEGNE